MNITINESEFYKEFINKVEQFTESVYQLSLLLKDNDEYTNQEMTTILLIDTVLFENIYAFINLIDDNLVNSAFTCFRSFMENYRLLILYLQDKEFRIGYGNNTNFDFRTVRDSNYVQIRVIKRLEKLTKENNDDFWPHYNKLYTRGSMFSELHSELSKLIHLTNQNILLLVNLEQKNENKGIYLGVGIHRPNAFCQGEILKLHELLLNTMGEYGAILKHIIKNTPKKVMWSNEYEELIKQVFSLYDDYIKKRYK